MNLSSGEVYLNTAFGDLWTVANNNSLIRINTGETVYVEDSSFLHFKKIGEIEGVQDLDTSFYTEFVTCPICGSHQISCLMEFNTMKWKIGCKTSDCPCCVDHMIGKYRYREEAVRSWNRRAD